MAGVWLNSLFTIDDAIARGFATWDLLVTGWGYQPAGPVVYDYSKSFPKVGEKGLPSVYGVAIGNQSSIDRCYVSYALEKLQINTDPDAASWDAAHRVSVGSPIMFPQAGQREIVQNPSPSAILAPENGKATLVVYPTATASEFSGARDESTLFTGAYRKADGTTASFTGATSYTSVLLHLVFFLQPPTVGAAPIRMPATWRGSGNAGVGTETLIGAIPTFGRKTVAITLRNGIGAATTWRIATIKNINLAPTIGEVTDTTFAAVPVSESRRLVITNCDSDAVLIYATIAAGAGSSTFEVCATDT